jgi:hypothetical protein
MTELTPLLFASFFQDSNDKNAWIMCNIPNKNSILMEAELENLFPDCEYEAAARVSNGFAWGEWSEAGREATVTESVRRLAR